MRESKERVSLFAHRLADIVEGDITDPDVYLADDTSQHLTDEGRICCKTTGAEAILIVRGPEASRKCVVERLLAALSR